MQEILRIENLSAGYGGDIVLRGIDLAVYEKDFLGIIGPNGGGKSTLLKVILGLIRPAKGTIQFSCNPKDIGYLPQLNLIDAQFPISALQVVLSGMVGKVGLLSRFKKHHKKKALELLERMGVGTFADKAIGTLSGGQKQRVFLSRALISQPRLLLLDEPNSFVDSQFEQDFYEILRALNQEIAIVMVSHDIGVISSHVKNIACINRTLHYHAAAELTEEILGLYQCPVDVISHGHIPHRVLKSHGGK